MDSNVKPKSKSKYRSKKKRKIRIEMKAEVREVVESTVPTVPTVGHKHIAIDCELDRNDEQLIEYLFECKQPLKPFNQLNDSSIFTFIVKSKKMVLELNRKLERLHRKKESIEKYIQAIDRKFEPTLSGIKLKKWCSMCHSQSNRRFDCCFNGFYCGYSHKKNDKNHFLDCLSEI